MMGRNREGERRRRSGSQGKTKIDHDDDVYACIEYRERRGKGKETSR